MKKAVIIMLVVLFSGNVFAGSACKNGTKLGLLASSNGSADSVSTSTTTGR